MARVSSHILNGVDGTHAKGIAVTLSRIEAEGSRLLFATDTDEGGRISEEIDLTRADTNALYELVFDTGAYWEEQKVVSGAELISGEIVLRFRMPDQHKTYHMPVILSPNSYSTWFSG